jgi:hypothetical protein
VKPATVTVRVVQRCAVGARGVGAGWEGAPALPGRVTVRRTACSFRTLVPARSRRVTKNKPMCRDTHHLYNRPGHFHWSVTVTLPHSLLYRSCAGGWSPHLTHWVVVQRRSCGIPRPVATPGLPAVLECTARHGDALLPRYSLQSERPERHPSHAVPSGLGGGTCSISGVATVLPWSQGVRPISVRLIAVGAESRAVVSCGRGWMG